MFYSIFMATLFFALAAYFIFGGGGKFRDAKSATAYLLHDEKLKRTGLVSTLVASNFSLGNMVFVCAIWGFFFGWSGVFWVVATIVALVLGFVIVGPKLKPYIIDKGNLGSLHDYISIEHTGEAKKGKRTLRSLSAWISSLSLLLALIIEAHIVSLLLSVIFPVSQELAYLTVVTVVVLYSIMGGFKAVVVTDIVQTLLVFAGIAAGILFFSIYFPVDLSGYDASPSHVLGGVGILNAAGIVVLGFFWLLATPDSWQRNCASRSLDTSMFGAIIGGIIMIIGVTFFALGGMYVQTALEPEIGSLTGYSSGYFPLIDLFLHQPSDMFSSVLMAVIATGLLMAAISTLDTFLIVISQAISVDISPATLRLGRMPERDSPASRGLLLRARMIVGVVAILIVFIWMQLRSTGFLDDPISVFFATYSIQFSLGIPVVMAAYKRKSHLGAILSILFGGVTPIVIGIVTIPHLSDAGPIGLGLTAADWFAIMPILTLGLGLIGFIFGSGYERVRGVRSTQETS